VAKDPLAGDDVGISRRTHKVLSVIAEESTVIRGHSIELVRILEYRMCGDVTDEYLLVG
jgi:hypothetical protein